MKIILAFVLGVCCWGKAEAQNWSWAIGAGGTGNDQAYRTTIDKFGNLFIAGWFSSSTITFGAFTLLNPFSGSGNRAIFIVKYKSNGDVVWAKSAGGSGDDFPTALASDKEGNLFLTGNFHGNSISFDSITLVDSVYSNLFIAKYDSIGNALWANCSGGNGDCISFSMVVDSFGSVYCGGYFFLSISFDSIILSAINNYSDLFVVKYDKDGNLIWAKSKGGRRHDDVTAMAIDEGNNIFLSGFFDSDTIIFDLDTLIDCSLFHSDIFTARINQNGDFYLAKKSSYGVTGQVRAQSISVGFYGDIYVAGYFMGALLTFDTIVLTQSGVADIFVASYDSTGNLRWAKRAGGTGQDVAYSVTTDKLGKVYIAGYFTSDTVLFGNSLLYNGSMAGNFFLAEYNSFGGALCAIDGIGPSYGSVAYSLTTDSSCNVYIAGGYTCDSIIFDTTTILNHFPGGADCFFAKYKFNCDAMDLSEVSKSFSSIQIFPNPATTSITITDTKQETIQFFDMLGRNISSVKTSSSGKTEVDVSDFPNFFFVKTQSGEVQKIIRN